MEIRARQGQGNQHGHHVQAHTSVIILPSICNRGREADGIVQPHVHAQNTRRLCWPKLLWWAKQRTGPLCWKG